MAVAVVSLQDNASLWEIGRDQGVTRFRYITHPELVKEVCLECLFYHDTVWETDDPSAPDPPLHPVCACTKEPEFDEGTVLGQDPDSNPIIADPAQEREPGEFLSERLNRLPAERLDRYVGPMRGRMIRAGLLKAGDLVSKAGIVNVDRLARGLGLDPEDIAEMTMEELRKLAKRLER